MKFRKLAAAALALSLCAAAQAQRIALLSDVHVTPGNANDKALRVAVREINNGDLIEDFVQGAQKLRRESPALRAYNTTIKSFSALTNQLVALLPEKEKKSAGDELMSFITKPAARSGK